MTTDRPTAPPRAVALPQRASSPLSGRQPDAPADAFSALLGAATPRTDDAPRSEPRGRRDDGPRPARRDDASKPADAPAKDDQPKATDAPTEPTTEEPTEPQPRLVTPDIFALALAGPLATTPAPPTTPAVPGVAVEGEGQATAQPTLPTFTPANLALTGQVPAAGAPATQAEPLTGAPAPAPTPAAGTPGGIPLPFLAGLTPASQAEVPAVELPTTPPTPAAPTADATAAPQPDAAWALPQAGEQTSSDTPQQQNPQAGSQTAQSALPAKPADAPAPSAAAQPLTPTAPVAPAVPTSAPVATERAVPLYRAPETAAALIRIAADRGITHAKLNLRPVELGGIEVRLKTTPQGVTAQLVADSAEAAKLLTQAADDLRRDLADRNVNLLSLDVSTQQQYQDQQAGQTQADIFGDDHQPGGARALRFGPQGDAGLAESPAPADTSLVLPNGVLVDVLA